MPQATNEKRNYLYFTDDADKRVIVDFDSGIVWGYTPAGDNPCILNMWRGPVNAVTSPLPVATFLTQSELELFMFGETGAPTEDDFAQWGALQLKTRVRANLA